MANNYSDIKEIRFGVPRRNVPSQQILILYTNDPKEHTCLLSMGNFYLFSFFASIFKHRSLLKASVLGSLISVQPVLKDHLSLFGDLFRRLVYRYGFQ